MINLRVRGIVSPAWTAGGSIVPGHDDAVDNDQTLSTHDVPGAGPMISPVGPSSSTRSWFGFLGH